MGNKDAEIARLQKRLAEIDQVHQAELEKAKTAATQAVSEATKRLEDAARAHADALEVANTQTASVQLELNRARDREDAYLQQRPSDFAWAMGELRLVLLFFFLRIQTGATWAHFLMVMI